MFVKQWNIYFNKLCQSQKFHHKLFKKIYKKSCLWPYNMEAIRVLYPLLCVIPRSSLNLGGAIFWANIECVSLVEAGKRWELQCSGPCSPACWRAWSFQVAFWQACFVWSDLINLLGLVWSGLLAGLLDLITWLDLANLPRLVGWVDLVAWRGRFGEQESGFGSWLSSSRRFVLLFKESEL